MDLFKKKLTLIMKDPVYIYISLKSSYLIVDFDKLSYLDM